MRERVTKGIICSAERQLEPHEVNYCSRRCNEENFHASVVDADEVHKEVHVSHTEHEQVDFLCLA